MSASSAAKSTLLETSSNAIASPVARAAMAAAADIIDALRANEEAGHDASPPEGNHPARDDRISAFEMDEVRAAPDPAAVRVGAAPSVTPRAGDVMARGEEPQPAAAHVEDSEPHGPGDGEHDVD